MRPPSFQKEPQNEAKCVGMESKVSSFSFGQPHFIQVPVFPQEDLLYEDSRKQLSHITTESPVLQRNQPGLVPSMGWTS